MPLLPNQDDVLYRGGRSFNYSFTHEAAAHTATTTSGGASVSYDKKGVQLTVGATSGDSTSLTLDDLGEFRKGIYERTVIYQTGSSTPPYTDSYKLGYIGPVDSRSAYLDFENGVYFASGATASATLPGNYRGCYLKITVDPAAGETTFAQQGDVTETVTINSADRVGGTLVDAVSNGAGDDPFRVPQASSAIIPPEL